MWSMAFRRHGRPTQMNLIKQNSQRKNTNRISITVERLLYECPVSQLVYMVGLQANIRESVSLKEHEWFNRGLGVICTSSTSGSCGPANVSTTFIFRNTFSAPEPSHILYSVYCRTPNNPTYITQFDLKLWNYDCKIQWLQLTLIT